MCLWGVAGRLVDFFVKVDNVLRWGTGHFLESSVLRFKDHGDRLSHLWNLTVIFLFLSFPRFKSDTCKCEGCHPEQEKAAYYGKTRLILGYVSWLASGLFTYQAKLFFLVWSQDEGSSTGGPRVHDFLVRRLGGLNLEAFLAPWAQFFLGVSFHDLTRACIFVRLNEGMFLVRT